MSYSSHVAVSLPCALIVILLTLISASSLIYICSPSTPPSFLLLNQIVCELPPEHPVSSVRPLRDSLGHTPLQVLAGAVLGCIVAYLMRSSS